MPTMCIGDSVVDRYEALWIKTRTGWQQLTGNRAFRECCECHQVKDGDRFCRWWDVRYQVLRYQGGPYCYDCIRRANGKGA